MIDPAVLYPVFVLAHILLFVAWLGGDIGVFILGQHFRKRDYPLDTRLTLLRLLVVNDMAPRTAWALMVPVSVTMTALGGWMALPEWIVWASWAVGGAWLWLVWTAHLNDGSPLAARLRRIEFVLKIGLTAAYLALGLAALIGLPGYDAPGWLAVKALMFAGVFAFAIMIDVSFKPVGPLLARLIEQGSSDAVEIPLRRTMDRTRIWVLGLYLLLLATAALGVLKPVF